MNHNSSAEASIRLKLPRLIGKLSVAGPALQKMQAS